jgi:MFS transporter, DHA1 family, multidrug resistance protein
MRLRSFPESLRRDRQAWPLLAMICITMIGSGMMAPVLSLYAATFGVTATLVGMLVTIFGVGRLMSNFPSGYLSQMVGRRPMLIAGAVIIGVGCVGAALATDFNHLIFWRFVQGVGSGMYMTVSSAALADLSTSESRARLVGLYQAALQLGATLGPVSGGFIASRFGLAAPFWALLVISAATAVVGVLTFKDQHAPISTRSAAMGAQRGLWTLPFISISLVSCVVFFTRTAFLFQLVPLVGDQAFALDVATIGLGVTISAGAILLVLPLTTMLIARLGSRLAVLISLVFSAVGIVLILGGDHPAWFWASMTVYGLATGLNGPAVGAFTIEALPRTKYGSGMGVQRTISDVGYVAGPVVVGLVSDWSSSGNAAGAWACGALLAVCVVLFAVATVAGKRRPS